MLRIIQPVDPESGLSQEVSVTSLTTRHIENARALRKSQHLDYARCFDAVALESENRLVFQEIPGVEIRLPPLPRFLQKKTGSRYAPNTSSIAARIS